MRSIQGMIGLLLVLMLPASSTGGEPRRDLYGDPLPPGAVLRLGTVRLRHGGTPTAALFLPDGKSLVSTAPADGHVAVWDVETGREVRRFTGVRRPLSLALSPDAKTLAVGEAADPYNVVLFEVSSGRELGRCCGHRDEVTALAFLVGPGNNAGTRSGGRPSRLDSGAGNDTRRPLLGQPK
jgi:WD40 repeat protein